MSTGPGSLQEHNDRQRRYFETNHKRTMVPRPSPYLRRHVEELVRFGGISGGERVLEVGSGMGRYTLLLAERGIRVEALDLSPVLLERLDAYNGGRWPIPLHCADIHEPPAELEGAFDVVVGLFVLHHLGDLERSMAAMARLLKPDGRVVFLEPNPYNPLYYVQIFLTPGMSWEGDGGIVRMRRGPLTRAMQGAGLVEPALARFGFFPPFLANRPWGARLERVLEAPALWRGCLPFQLVRARRGARG